MTKEFVEIQEETDDKLFSQMLSAQLITEEDIQDWLVTKIAEQLGKNSDKIDIKAPFDSYGLESVQAMSIASLGRKYLGLNLSPLLIWSYPNIESLSRYLFQQLQASEKEMFEI
jgi:acyl carrier protein